MEAVSEAFSEHGGHHYSGGFSVHEEQIHHLPTQLSQALQDLGVEAAVSEVIEADHTLNLEEITEVLLREQQMLAPFGVGNPKPLYKITDVVPLAVDIFGKGKEHTKLRLDTSGIAREAIAFFQQPDSFTKTPVAGESLTLLAHLEQSHFMGRLQTRLRLVDIL